MPDPDSSRSKVSHYSNKNTILVQAVTYCSWKQYTVFIFALFALCITWTMACSVSSNKSCDHRAKMLTLLRKSWKRPWRINGVDAFNVEQNTISKARWTSMDCIPNPLKPVSLNSTDTAPEVSLLKALNLFVSQPWMWQATPDLGSQSQVPSRRS